MTITIPPEAVEAHAKEMHDRAERSICGDHTGLKYRAWEDISEEEREEGREDSRAAIRAMLSTWPGMKAARQGTVFTNTWQSPEKGERVNIIILPLPQEPET
jgi:hypothetical protein